MDPANSDFITLLSEIRSCRICAEQLPCAPRPVLQAATSARLLIAAQAPGRKVQQSGIPFDDVSGERLRAWTGLSRETFYDAAQVALVPMGFCYPGTGKSGDLPPRPECAVAWRARLLQRLEHIQLTLVIGSYAQAFHFPQERRSLTEVVASWRSFWPTVVPLPHPSPRNNVWLQRNPWFAAELLPELRQRIAAVLK